MQLLTADANVVHSYAAITIERLLALKLGGVPLLAPADVAAHLQPLLGNLFGAFEKADSAENEYLMKAVMRVISFVGPQIIPVAPICLEKCASPPLVVMDVLTCMVMGEIGVLWVKLVSLWAAGHFCRPHLP